MRVLHWETMRINRVSWSNSAVWKGYCLVILFERLRVADRIEIGWSWCKCQQAYQHYRTRVVWKGQFNLSNLNFFRSFSWCASHGIEGRWMRQKLSSIGSCFRSFWNCVRDFWRVRWIRVGYLDRYIENASSIDRSFLNKKGWNWGEKGVTG